MTDERARPQGGAIMPTSATALFGDRHATRAAIEQLVQAGFPRNAISIIMSDSTHGREFGERSSAERGGARPAQATGVLGAIASGLIEVTEPGGAIRAAGPVVAYLLRRPELLLRAGLRAALGAAGLEENEVRFLQEGVQSGAIVVRVQTGRERMRLATQLLELSGGAALPAA